ncbi:diguanylate phosphodiesterase [Gluconacetobacter sacchari]|uniref:Diguanylate phosphodiesterase n=1 Tax=Gluconacetobacter sacchari TaxID=92759 RepID=A0A7W4IHB8_9PROT|nr:diguanylate phosphodiesterase [Gluconacetobacter sacchari]MBB2162909.1 diguanylate phosphodiesterase [Gluconacetobacter sacchari]
MLTVLVYRSKKISTLSPFELDNLIRNSDYKNKLANISGVLFYNDDYFFQIIEGEENCISNLYHEICADDRHDDLVKILETQIPTRYFENFGMISFDIRKKTRDDLLLEIKNQSRNRGKSPYFDRVLRVVSSFTSGVWCGEENYKSPCMEWIESCVDVGSSPISSCLDKVKYKFSVQPIINPLERKISSYEFLLRTDKGGPPHECFSLLSSHEQYVLDATSKLVAFEWASKIIEGETKISVNLLPMTLVNITGIVDDLVSQLNSFSLNSGQVIIEITEEEVISEPKKFSNVIKCLRAAGFGIAIDDFGAGFAGLSLITKFQPDKIKIDRLIIKNINKDGPRQMIVRSVLTLCRSLGIEVVAEGVENIEEWRWLESVGINLFQGYLFSRPNTTSSLSIKWPKLK